MWTEEDKIDSQERIETALGYLRHEESKSPTKVAMYTKVIKAEVEFLKENFPDSHVLVSGYLDVDM